MAAIRSAHVVVVGAGPAGLACALTLRSLSVDVTLLDAEEDRSYRPGEYLSAVGRSLLSDLDFPDDALKRCATPCWEVRSSWGTDDQQIRESLFDPHGESWVLFRPEFDARLAQHAEDRNVRIKCCTRALGAEWKNEQWHVLVRERQLRCETLLCDFIVDASGRTSAFARNLGAKSVRHDKLIGMTGMVSIPSVHSAGHHLLLEAVSSGWWYSTRLHNCLAVSFMTDGDLIDRTGNSLASAWTRLLGDAPLTGARVGDGRLLGDLKCRPAHTQELRPCHGQRWLAIGDAATSFDPLSSQGICKGLKDGRLAAIAVADSLKGKTDALSDFAKGVQRRLLAYLVQRRIYYGLEARWTEQNFWRRRHSQTWAHTAIWLNPVTWIAISDSLAEEDAKRLEAITPSINYARLVEAIDAGCRAKEAVRHYKSLTGESSDQEIIVALQTLLEATKRVSSKRPRAR